MLKALIHLYYHMSSFHLAEDMILKQATFYSPCACQQLLTSSPPRLTLAGWELNAIGSGAFGRVYAAHCKATGCYHALKILENVGMASREFYMARRRATAKDTNLGIIICTGPCVQDRIPAHDKELYMVLQELLQVDLFDLIADPRAQPYMKARSCALQHVAFSILNGTNGASFTRFKSKKLTREDLHQVGIVHGDLKPENIMLSFDNKLKIIDLGVAYHVAEPRRVGGTYQYLPPEHIFGMWKTGNGGDIFSIAMLLLELWHGSCVLPREMIDAYSYRGDAIHSLEQRNVAPLYHLILLSSIIAGREVWAGKLLRKYYGNISKPRLQAKVTRAFPSASQEICALLVSFITARMSNTNLLTKC